MKTQLKKYLFEHDLSLIEMSEIFGCNKAYLCRIVNGLKPGKRLAKDIITFTNGTISFDDHVNTKQEQEQKKKRKAASAVWDSGT